MIVTAVRMPGRLQGVGGDMLCEVLGPIALMSLHFMQRDEGRKHYAKAEAQHCGRSNRSLEGWHASDHAVIAMERQQNPVERCAREHEHEKVSRSFVVSG